MSERTMEWAISVSRELAKGADPEAEQRLRDKCNWEHRTRTYVILNYGDPREWR